MSFLDIKDPFEREETVKDYLATVKRIQERNESEKMGEYSRRRDLEQKFQPVVERAAEEIAKKLKPGLIKKEENEVKEEEGEEEEGENVNRQYFNQFKMKVLSRDQDVDTSFGIYFTPDGTTRMGNKVVRIDRNDNIHVGNQTYEGTKGLWRLITGVTRDQIGDVDHEYTKYDLLEYVELIKQTSVLHKDFDPDDPQPRSNRSWKWRNFLKALWESIRKERNEKEEGGAGLPLRDPIRACKLYVQKGGKCCRVRQSGNGLYLSPYPTNRSSGDGLFLRAGGTLYDGRGLLLGSNSPFQNIPILNILL